MLRNDTREMQPRRKVNSGAIIPSPIPRNPPTRLHQTQWRLICKRPKVIPYLKRSLHLPGLHIVEILVSVFHEPFYCDYVGKCSCMGLYSKSHEYHWKTDSHEDIEKQGRIVVTSRHRGNIWRFRHMNARPQVRWWASLYTVVYLVLSCQLVSASKSPPL